MSNDRLKYLLEQYAADTSTAAETEELFGRIRKSNDDVLLKDKIQQLWAGHKNDKELPDVDWNTIYEKIINTPLIGKRHIWPRIAAASVIILLLSAGGYFIFNNHSANQFAKTEKQKPFKNDVAPGGYKAILTLANGTQIILDSAANGALTQQGNTKIIKLDSGRLAYNRLNEKPGQVLYNTISTPRGGQYQIVLTDGSKVWLNAASSLRFPTFFSGKERNVELTGEGYFEVAKNKEKPFHVNVKGMQVEVLGTHFNVNAYEDENTIKTSLLEGSVKIKSAQGSGLLKPGEQVVLNKKANKIEIKKADMEEVVAWKNGLFQFDGASITTIMREISRWYDVDIIYKVQVPVRRFEGKISRDAQLSDVLKILELSDVKFNVEGKKIIVQ